MAKIAGFVCGRGRTRVLFLAAFVAIVGAIAATRPWIAAQAQAFVVGASVVDAPGLTWLVTRATDEPRLAEARIGGVAATIAQTEANGPWPAIVLLNGATALGRHDERIRALTEGFARAGFLVVVPELPGLRHGEVTREALRAAVAVAEASARRADVRDGKIALFGMSTGGSLALLVAEHASLARLVRVVAAMGAFTDIRAALRLATTRTYEDDGRLVGYRPEPYLSLVVGRSLIAALPSNPDRLRLSEALEDADPNAVDPLATLWAIPRAELAQPARAVVALLLNREPRQFDALYAALPAAVRAACQRLSPVSGAARLRVPVLLAADARDAYFPPAQARELTAAAPDGTVTTIRTVSHSAPRAFPWGLVDVIRLDQFLVRALRLASA